MAKRNWLTGLVAGLAVVALACWVADLGAQVKKGKSRPLHTECLMEGLVGPQCGALKTALAEKPADDKAWKHASIAAELLNESGHILMADGRCPDGEWAGAAKTLQDCSAAVVAAIEAKDHEKAKAAFGEMTKACGACHKAHKK